MTELTVLQRIVSEKIPQIKFSYFEPMSKHTSFRIGGNAEVMVFPKCTEELSEVLKMSAMLDIKPAILGAGTNVLAPDEGMRGIVVCLKDGLDGIERIDETRIRVKAGVTMARAAVYAANIGLSGMEFAHGIPGTVGGGVYMNAGAYGGEMCQICDYVEVMEFDGSVRTYSSEAMGFSYRHSILEDRPSIVTSVVFRLVPDSPEVIRGKMKDLMARRSASQPLDMPSAGSAFKRPIGGFAAALIDGAGLKGYQVGNAAISTKHAGFAVNLGGATAEDVKTLLREVSDIVFAKSGIRLEPEVRIW